jgi:hypothetical protein
MGSDPVLDIEQITSKGVSRNMRSSDSHQISVVSESAIPESTGTTTLHSQIHYWLLLGGIFVILQVLIRCSMAVRRRYPVNRFMTPVFRRSISPSGGIILQKRRRRAILRILLRGSGMPKYVAIQESGWQNNRTYLQFNEIGAYNCDSNDIRHTPNWGDDGQGQPGGFGMFQLTYFTDIGGNTRVPNSNELWNWKANACAGENYLDLLQAQANQYMAYERNEANNCTGEYVYNPPDDYVSGNVIFSGEQWADTTIEHAVALKRFNGLGIEQRDFCEFDYGVFQWRFYPYATYEHDGQIDTSYYVSDICDLVN